MVSDADRATPPSWRHKAGLHDPLDLNQTLSAPERDSDAEPTA
jgi:hypothetical protein